MKTFNTEEVMEGRVRLAFRISHAHEMMERSSLKKLAIPKLKLLVKLKP